MTLGVALAELLKSTSQTRDVPAEVREVNRDRHIDGSVDHLLDGRTQWLLVTLYTTSLSQVFQDFRSAQPHLRVAVGRSQLLQPSAKLADLPVSLETTLGQLLLLDDRPPRLRIASRGKAIPRRDRERVQLRRKAEVR